MICIPVRTRRIEAGDDLASLLNAEVEIRTGDILVVSSKVVATAEGRIVDLQTLAVTEEARVLSKRCGRTAAFCQAVIVETEARNGKVAGTCPGAILTELKPAGLPEGTILAANAGLDESNIEAWFAVGWPADPVASVRRLRRELEAKRKITNHQSPITKEIPSPKSQVPSIAVILSDSCLRPRRWGVTAYALAVSGIDPIRDEAGRTDLFGKPLRITKEAIADQLATAANFLMGNADQSVPAVIIRDHGLELSGFEGWVPGVEPGEDIFGGVQR